MEIILKVFDWTNGHRSYKPKSQHKHININDAQEYILDKQLVFYDLVVDGKVLDRDGNGAPLKKQKKEKSTEPIIISFVNPERVVKFLTLRTSVEFTGFYELTKNSGMIAVTMQSANDAARVIHYLNNCKEAFKILQISNDELSLSFETITESFTETKEWQPTKLPEKNITKSSTKTQSLSLPTFAQILLNTPYQLEGAALLYSMKNGTLYAWE